jgi:hypothetical protein
VKKAVKEVKGPVDQVSTEDSSRRSKEPLWLSRKGHLNDPVSRRVRRGVVASRPASTLYRSSSLSQEYPRETVELAYNWCIICELLGSCSHS